MLHGMIFLIEAATDDPFAVRWSGGITNIINPPLWRDNTIIPVLSRFDSSLASKRDNVIIAVIVYMRLHVQNRSRS